MQSAAHENRLCVCAPLGIGHSDWENASVYQSSHWNAYQKVAEHFKKACGGVLVDCGCGIGSVK